MVRIDKELSPGLAMSNICEICGKMKHRKDHNKVRCSKLKQRMYAKQKRNMEKQAQS